MASSFRKLGIPLGFSPSTHWDGEKPEWRAVVFLMLYMYFIQNGLYVLVQFLRVHCFDNSTMMLNASTGFGCLQRNSV